MRSATSTPSPKSTRLWDSDCGRLPVGSDPLKNAKYRFVTTITLASLRFAIEGGDEEDAHNASGPVHPEPGKLQNARRRRRLHTDMMTFFTWAMADMQKVETHSKAVNECLDYIHYHLHEKITVPILAEHVYLNPNVSVGAVQTRNGTAISQYITDVAWKRSEHAQILGIQLRRASPASSHTGRKATSRRCSKYSGMTPGSRTKYAQNGIWPGGGITASTTPVAVNRGDGTAKFGCANREIDVSARAKHARISYGGSIQHDARHRPNERRNKERAQDVDESEGINEYGNAPRFVCAIRHGESEANVIISAGEQGDNSLATQDNVTVPDRSWRLTATGCAQADCIGRWPAAQQPLFDRHLVSPYVRIAGVRRRPRWPCRKRNGRRLACCTEHALG